jgi:hypothetical protein
MKHMQLLYDTVIAGYDDIRPAFPQSASKTGQREYSTITVDMANAG